MFLIDKDNICNSQHNLNRIQTLFDSLTFIPEIMVEVNRKGQDIDPFQAIPLNNHL